MEDAERDKELLSLIRMARRADVNPYSTLLCAIDAELKIREMFPAWPDCRLADVLRRVPEALEAPSWRDELERRREAYARTFVGWARSTPEMRDRGAKLIEPITTSSAHQARLKRDLEAVARWIESPRRDSVRVERRLREFLALLVPAEARRLKDRGDDRPIAEIRRELLAKHGENVQDGSLRKRRQRRTTKGDKS